MGSTASGGSALHLRSPTLDLSNPGGSAIEPLTTASPESAAPAVVALNPGQVPPKVSVNVLNDIGNMLANLTDELDAMLEEEKRVGLNIDSE